MEITLEHFSKFKMAAEMAVKIMFSQQYIYLKKSIFLYGFEHARVIKHSPSKVNFKVI